VSAYENSFVVTGENGTVILGTEDDTLRTCQIGTDDIISIQTIFNGYYGQEIVALTSKGNIIFNRGIDVDLGTLWYFFDSSSSFKHVLAAGFQSCGLNSNPILLNSKTLRVRDEWGCCVD